MPESLPAVAARGILQEKSLVLPLSFTEIVQSVFWSLQLPEPAISSPDDVVELALKCILCCPRTDQLEQMTAIIQCLPSQETLPDRNASMFLKISRVQDLIT